MERGSKLHLEKCKGLQIENKRETFQKFGILGNDILGSSCFVLSVGQIRLKRKAGIILQEVSATLVQENGKSCLSAGALLLISALVQN